MHISSKGLNMIMANGYFNVFKTVSMFEPLPTIESKMAVIFYVCFPSKFILCCFWYKWEYFIIKSVEFFYHINSFLGSIKMKLLLLLKQTHC